MNPPKTRHRRNPTAPFTQQESRQIQGVLEEIFEVRNRPSLRRKRSHLTAKLAGILIGCVLLLLSFVLLDGVSLLMQESSEVQTAVAMLPQPIQNVLQELHVMRSLHSYIGAAKLAEEGLTGGLLVQASLWFLSRGLGAGLAVSGVYFLICTVRIRLRWKGFASFLHAAFDRVYDILLITSYGGLFLVIPWLIFR